MHLALQEHDPPYNLGNSYSSTSSKISWWVLPLVTNILLVSEVWLMHFIRLFSQTSSKKVGAFTTYNLYKSSGKYLWTSRTSYLYILTVVWLVKSFYFVPFMSTITLIWSTPFLLMNSLQSANLFLQVCSNSLMKKWTRTSTVLITSMSSKCLI